MGYHIDNRTKKHKKVKEHDENARRSRTSFKQYLRELEEELLEEDLTSDDILEDDQDEN